MISHSTTDITLPIDDILSVQVHPYYRLLKDEKKQIKGGFITLIIPQATFITKKDYKELYTWLSLSSKLGGGAANNNEMKMNPTHYRKFAFLTLATFTLKYK